MTDKNDIINEDDSDWEATKAELQKNVENFLAKQKIRFEERINRLEKE